MYSPQFQRSDGLMGMVARIEASRAVVLRSPIAAQWESQLRHEALIRSAHHSTSIEGNPLSLLEVTDLLEGRDVAAHPREKREVLNYAEVLDYIDQEYRGRRSKPLADNTIRQLHRVLMHDLLPEDEAGAYRRVPVVVGIPATGEVRFRPPAWDEVPDLMAELVDWLNSPSASGLMPVLHAGIAHYGCVRIHPFVDGNGRTARALATLILYMRGFDTRRFFALEEYYNTDRRSYYEALATADESGDLTEWLEYFAGHCSRDGETRAAYRGTGTGRAARDAIGDGCSGSEPPPNQVAGVPVARTATYDRVVHPVEPCIACHGSKRFGRSCHQRPASTAWARPRHLLCPSQL